MTFSSIVGASQSQEPFHVLTTTEDSIAIVAISEMQPEGYFAVIL